MDRSSMLNVKITFNNKTFPTNVNPNTPLNAFLVSVMQSFNLNPSHFLLKHKNTPILVTDIRPLSVLTNHSNTALAFNIIAIPPKPTQLTLASPTVIRIENAFNHQLASSLIDSFITSKQLNQSSIAKEFNSSVVRLTLPSKQLAADFIQFVSQMKQANRSMKHLKASVEQTTASTSSMKQLKGVEPFSRNSVSNKSQGGSLGNNQSITLPSIRNDRYDTITQEADMFNRKMISKYYSSQEYIRNSSPYVEEEEKRLQEYHKDKKKWIVNDGFVTSVGKYRKGNAFIPNYVNLTPSESPLNHRFRDIKKTSWIDKKGFLVC